MEYKITTRDVPDQRVVFVRGWTTLEGLSAFIRTAVDQLAGSLAVHGGAPNGETLLIYHEFGTDGIDAELCLPVALDTVVGDPRKVRVVPGSTVAETLHVGPYDGLPQAYAAVVAWVGRTGSQQTGPARERYLVGPGEDVPEADYQTIVEVPIAGAAVPVG